MIYINEKKFCNINLSSLDFYVVLDFDNTITTKDSSNSWSVLENPKFMSSKFIEASHNLASKYYPYELDYTLDFSTKSKYLQEWYIKNMNLFYEYGLNSNILDLCVCNANVHFRQGFKKFLKGLYDNNIPVIILSAGIGNVIYNLLRINDCLYDNIDIVSNFIDFSDDGNMLKYNKFMIHSCNKSLECANNACNSTFRKKKHALLFGDLIEDLSMIPKKDLDKCLCFGFLDKMVDTNFEFYMDAFDVVLTDNGSFEDVIMVLNKFKKS